MTGQCPVCGTSLDQQETVRDGWIRIPCSRCGAFRIRETLGGRTDYPPLLSAWLRHRTDQGQENALDEDRLTQIEDTLPTVGVGHKVDHVLLALERLTRVPGEFVELDPEIDAARSWTANREEFAFLLESLADRGLIELEHDDVRNWRARLTTRAWEHIEAGHHDQRRRRMGFVAMWNDHSVTAAYEDGILPGIVDADCEAYRIETDEANLDAIDIRLLNQIAAASFVIADVTGQRQNVYFEAGYALALRKPVFWTVREDQLEQVAFDTRQFPHVVWTDPADLRTQLTQRILAVLGPRSPIPDG